MGVTSCHFRICPELGANRRQAEHRDPEHRQRHAAIWNIGVVYRSLWNGSAGKIASKLNLEAPDDVIFMSWVNE